MNLKKIPMYSTGENCVFIWKLFNKKTADEYDDMFTSGCNLIVCLNRRLNVGRTSQWSCLFSSLCMSTWSTNKLTHWEFVREVHWKFSRKVSWEFASVVLRIRAESGLRMHTKGILIVSTYFMRFNTIFRDSACIVRVSRHEIDDLLISTYV